MAEDSNKLLYGALLGIGAFTAVNILRKSREYDFKNKVVLITGGSRGLGLVMAREFAAEGAKIAICARNKEELARAQVDLQKHGADVFSSVCDVRDENEVHKLVKEVHSVFGRVDVLVNNAGVIQVGPLEEQTQEDFRDAMDLHFWGAYHMMQAVLPEMRERGNGRIVNIASIGGKVSVPHLAPYCASKFALVGLSSAMRVELAKENIFVTTVCPGLMRTGSHINAIFKGQNDKEYAWFSIGNSSPLSSVSAESAARQIVQATKTGKASLTISIQAELATKINSLLPNLSAEIAGLVNQLLPAPGGIGKAQTRGKNSSSWLSPSFLTASVDEASARNNELKPNEQIV